MKKLTFRRIRGIGSFEIDLEHLTVIAGDDDVAKEVLMTCMYAMVESMSDAHGDGDRASVLDDILKREFGCRKRILDGASMEAEDASIGVSDAIEVKGSLGITKTVLYDSPLVVRGLFADDDDHRAELWDLLMDPRPEVNPFDAEPEGYRAVMDMMCPGDLEPVGGRLMYMLPDGATVDPFMMTDDVVFFAVVKRLRRAGVLSRGSLLFLSDPDSGMHNHTVNRMSEVLGHLAKDMGVGVIMCTNSPDLVSACMTFPYLMYAPVDLKMVSMRDGVPEITDVDCSDVTLTCSLDRPACDLVLDMRRRNYPWDEVPETPTGVHVSVSGVKGVPDFDMWIDRMVVVSGTWGTCRGRIPDLLYSVLEPMSGDHEGEDRAELVLKRIDGLLGGVCNLRPQGADAIVECDGMRVEVNGDVVVSGTADIRHVVYIREPPVLGYDILGVTFPGLYEQLIREPVRGTDEEPDEYRRIMDGACPGDLVHEGGSFRFIDPDGTVTEPCDMRPSSMVLSVLKRLRSNGSLCEGSLLIIRNPEAYMHPSILRMLIELLVVMSGRMGVRVLVLTQELLVTIGSHILSCMHGTEIGYLLVSDDSIHACTSSALDGINKAATKEMDDLWWGEDA